MYFWYVHCVILVPCFSLEWLRSHLQRSSLATRCILASYLFKQLSPLVPSQSSNGKFLAFRNFVGISWNASFPIQVMIFLMLAVFHLARVVSQSHCITTFKGAEKIVVIANFICGYSKCAGTGASLDGRCI